MVAYSFKARFAEPILAGTKRGNKVTFYTDAISPNDLVQPDKCKVVGLVLWLPRDKVDAAVKASESARAIGDDTQGG